MLAVEECYHPVFPKLLNHMWYLSEELIALSLFDPEVPLPQKRKVVKSMQINVVGNEPPKKHKFDMVNKLDHMELHNFATSNTYRFFTILDIDHTFLESDPGLWQRSKSYNDALGIVKYLSH